MESFLPMARGLAPGKAVSTRSSAAQQRFAADRFQRRLKPGVRLQITQEV